MSGKLHMFGHASQGLWRRLAGEVGGEFLDENGWRYDKVEAHDGNWTVTIDIHSVPHYRHEAVFTRIRAPYVNPDGFRFNIYKQTFWSDLAAMLGMQDIRTGHSNIDDHFIVKANSESQVRKLLENDELRQLIANVHNAHLYVRDSGDWYAQRFPEGVDELVLEVEGRVTNYERLRMLFNLFSETLHTLCHIGSAYEDDPHL